MKTITTLSVFLLLSTMIFSQTWSPDGAKWHYNYGNLGGQGFVVTEYVNDSLIMGKNCKVFQKVQKIYSSIDYMQHTYDLGEEFTYLDTTNNVVYRLVANQFDTLYNFNALPGDRWTVRNHYGYVGIVNVDSIGTKIINGETLKAIYVSTIDPGFEGSCIGWQSAEIVERVGPINEYMFPEFISCAADGQEGGALRCYEDNSFNLYSTNSSIDCDFILASNSLDDIDELIDVYPNPVSQNLVVSIKNEKLNDSKLILLNTLGQIIAIYDVTSFKALKIDMNELDSGVYFLQVFNDQVIYGSKKILKE